MKRVIAAVLALSLLLLCGCGAKAPAPTQAPATVPTQASTEAPTQAPTEIPTDAPTEPEEVVYTNPLTGETLDAPFDRRVFGITVSNIPDAIPHHGSNQAAILFEMLVNGSIIRCFGLFTDPDAVPLVGSVRSTRIMFNDLASHYDLVLIHAGGSNFCLSDARARKLDNFNIDTQDETGYSVRDKARREAGYGWEHVLFAKGPGLSAEAERRGIDLSQDPDKDYNLRFREDGTPADGQDARDITVTFTYKGTRKETGMVYHEDLGKYVFRQYGKEMVDEATGEPEAFENVLILLADIHMDGEGYHEADLVAGGSGYYACGGKLIPITWGADDGTSPLWFRTADGELLEMGVGNSYIAIAPIGSPVSYE